MDAKFRIKEVLLEIEGGNITVYYPQVEISYTEQKGHLWWKTSEEKKEWCCLHRDKGEGKYKGVLYYEKFSTTELVVCESFDEAEKIINELIAQSIKQAQDRCRKSAHNWTSEKLVKIHELKK